MKITIAAAASALFAIAFITPNVGAENGAARTPRAFMSPMRTDHELVRVQLGEVRMAIPAAYLDAPIQQDERSDVFLTEDGFHVTQGVYIVTELPELTARTEESMREWLKGSRLPREGQVDQRADPGLEQRRDRWPLRKQPEHPRRSQRA